MCINGERFTLCEIPRSEPGVYRLYDHVADPKLTTDIAAEHPETVERLRHAWANWPPDRAGLGRCAALATGIASPTRS